MNRRNKRPGLQKEKMFIVAASVLVLSALTLTGVYIADKDDSENEGNLIDFAQLEQQQNNADTKDNLVADDRYVRNEESQLSGSNDMDVDPEYTETNSGDVKNDRAKAFEEAKNLNEAIQEAENTDTLTAGADAVGPEEELAATGEQAEEIVETASAPAAPLTFSESETLQWPVVGNVLLNYSMDKAIYFKTMQQYRYNPSIVIEANVGETITAAADASVEKVYYDAQTGNSILFDLGDGYELTYGQLTDITVAEGDRVEAGDVVGTVANPSIYYNEEGSNVYFKLTKDGVPVNPLSRLE